MAEWFRHEAHAHNNYKLRLLSERLQLRFWWLVECHTLRPLREWTVADLAWELRVNPSELEDDILDLIDAELLLSDKTPKGFDERHFATLDRAAYMRNWRKRNNKGGKPNEKS